MNVPREDGDRPDGDASPASSPSARVRLEVAILASDQSAPVAVAVVVDGHERRTVLVIAAETDVRRYVRECLRERTEFRVIEASTVAVALDLVRHEAPHLLIVDAPEAGVLGIVPQMRAILIADEHPRRAAAPGARLAVLAQPFTAEGLVAQVDRLLA